MNYLDTNAKISNQARLEFKRPNDFLPQSKIHDFAKFALIICNETYCRKYTTHSNLPAVKNDLKNTKNLASMIGTPDENITILKNATNKSIRVVFK